MSSKEYESIESELLTSIVRELSELNRNFSKADYRGSYPSGGGMYFFNGSSSRIWTSDEHLLYSSFMKSVTDYLKDFGIHVNNNGYTYIIEAVKIMMDYGSSDVRMINDVYPFIAGRYSPGNHEAIEHSIRNAINAAYKDYLKDPYCNRMGLFRKKPTNKEFIIYITEQVSRTLHDSVYPVLS